MSEIAEVADLQKRQTAVAGLLRNAEDAVTWPARCSCRRRSLQPVGVLAADRRIALRDQRDENTCVWLAAKPCTRTFSSPSLKPAAVAIALERRTDEPCGLFEKLVACEESESFELKL
jgi:hypothetical protein